MEYYPYGGSLSKVPCRLQHAFKDIAEATQEEYGWGVSRGLGIYSGGHYPYIPLGLYTFENLMRDILHDGMRVIDVGCGAGDKLYSWHTLNPKLRITGLEYNPTMVACARYICGHFAEIIEGDALQHDYGRYDLIYMYRPMVHAEGQSALQERVMSTMKLGARLLVFYAQMHNPRTNVLFPDLTSGWVKEGIYDPESAEFGKPTEPQIALGVA